MSDAAVSDAVVVKVLDGVELSGDVNTPDAQLLANIRHSIRLGYPQVKLQPLQRDRVCLVGGGPSLVETFAELRDLYFTGAKLVTVNGAYHWCLDRNLRPSAQIVLDARPGNARFVEPNVPQCRYLLASQCHPDTWAAVADREDVWIWHGIAPDEAIEQELVSYYAGNWHNIGHGPIGGTTVMIRAIALLRTLGFLRFDLFGADSCVMGSAHHAYAQPENDRDRIFPVTVSPSGHPELRRTFHCTAWHLKQLEDFCLMIRERGDHFLLNIHGDGLLAYALKSGARVTVEEAAATQAD